MKKGLFFDRIDGRRGNLAVSPGEEPAAAVLPDAANSEMARVDFAAVGAQAADDQAAFRRDPQAGFVETDRFHRIVRRAFFTVMSLSILSGPHPGGQKKVSIFIVAEMTFPLKPPDRFR
jgi:hypothetical protein